MGIKVSWTHDVSDEATLLLSPFFGIKDTTMKSTSIRQLFLNLKPIECLVPTLQLSGEDYRWNLSFLDSNFDQTVKHLKTLDLFQKQDNQHIQLWSLGAEYEFGQAILRPVKDKPVTSPLRCTQVWVTDSIRSLLTSFMAR